MKAVLHIISLMVLSSVSNMYSMDASYIELSSIAINRAPHSPNQTDHHNDDLKEIDTTRTKNNANVLDETGSNQTSTRCIRLKETCLKAACCTLLLAVPTAIAVGIYFLPVPCQPTIYCFDNIPDVSYDISSKKWSAVRGKYDDGRYWPTNCAIYKSNGTLPTDKELLVAVNKWFLAPRWANTSYMRPYCIRNDDYCPVWDEYAKFCSSYWNVQLGFDKPGNPNNDTQSSANIPTIFETFANTTIANNTTVNATNNARNDNATQMNETRTNSKQHKLRLQQALWSALAPINVVEQNARTKNNSRKNLARSNITCYTK